MSYNGWKNYETWNVALWIDNDQGSYRHSRSLAQDAWDNAEASRSFTRDEQAALDLSEMLKDMVEEQNPLASDASTFSDLLSAALSEVDWHEIAENYLEDIDKGEDEETEDEDIGDDDLVVGYAVKRIGEGLWWDGSTWNPDTLKARAFASKDEANKFVSDHALVNVLVLPIYAE